jgi:hypothetical protein
MSSHNLFRRSRTDACRLHLIGNRAHLRSNSTISPTRPGPAQPPGLPPVRSDKLATETFCSITAAACRDVMSGRATLQSMEDEPSRSELLKSYLFDPFSAFPFSTSTDSTPPPLNFPLSAFQFSIAQLPPRSPLPARLYRACRSSHSPFNFPLSTFQFSVVRFSAFIEI